MPKFLIKLSQFSHQKDTIQFSLSGNEPGLDDFYADLLGAEDDTSELKSMNAHGEVQRLTDEYFMISAHVKFQYAKGCSSCGELLELEVTESFQRGASFDSKSDDDYHIRNKEINLLEPMAEVLNLAMPENIRCPDCFYKNDLNSEQETSCVYSGESVSSGAFAAALGNLSFSEKNFTK